MIAHGSEDMPARDVVADLAAADRFLAERPPASAAALALNARGFTEVAGASSGWAASASRATISSPRRSSIAISGC